MSSEGPQATVQPKTVQRMLLRFAIGLILIAGLVLGYQALKSCGKDIDLPAFVQTEGMIAAIQYVDDGARVVLIDPQGVVRSNPGYAKGVTDRDAVWRPDGCRVFFVSDREADVYQVYRWNPGGDAVERKSVGRRSKFSPAFGPPGSPEADHELLITAGGFVVRLDPATGHTQQILPPVATQAGGAEGEGATGQFDAVYQRLGTSFRAARWTADKRFVAAVMRREDGSEVLVVQNVVDLGRPIPVAAGLRIDFDVSPVDGRVVFCALDFQFPDLANVPPAFVKDGRIVPPFRHVIGLFDPAKERAEPEVIAYSKDDALAFRQVAVSPDGSMLLTVAGKYSDPGDVVPESLDVMPLEANGGMSAARVTTGKIFEPAWSADSFHIAFVRLGADGERSIHVIQRDGGKERNLTKGKGNFAWPKPSPQKPG